MKLFQLVQKYYHSVGIYPTDESSPISLFNLRICWFLLITSAFFASTITSFAFQSTTIMDYAESFYIFSTTFASMINFIATIWKARKIFTFINELEEYMQMSQFNRLKQQQIAKINVFLFF